MRILMLPWLASSLCGQTALYEIKPSSDSRFALEIYKTGLMSGKKHLLLFERFAGALNYNSTSPEVSKLDLNVESASFVVKDDWVSASQARSIRQEAAGKNGLEVTRYPQIRFIASSIAKSGDAFTIQGTLTIRGVDKPVTVQVSMKLEPAGGALRFEGKAEVKLKDYGIKPPTAALGAVGTKNEMAVSFSLIATPRR